MIFQRSHFRDAHTFQRWHFKIREKFWYKLLPYELVNPAIKISLFVISRRATVRNSLFGFERLGFQNKKKNAMNGRLEGVCVCVREREGGEGGTRDTRGEWEIHVDAVWRENWVHVYHYEKRELRIEKGRGNTYIWMGDPHRCRVTWALGVGVSLQMWKLRRLERWREYIYMYMYEWVIRVDAAWRELWVSVHRHENESCA